MAITQKEPVAIIGSGCRFPGEASSPSKLWELLKEPRDVLRKIPVERFNTNGVYNPDRMYHGSTNVRESYLLSEDYRHFDAGFFKIPPIEAQSMDPQQRILLETVYEALDSAGQSISLLRGSNTAVYVGLMSEEYGEILSRDIDYLPTYFPTATARSIMSNRVSYVFDWHGPCMTIDTACSSSLVAVHQAVQALRNGDATMAVASGSNLCIGSKPYISENKLNMLSPGSRSRMWDQDADGYARGDGVATVVLKTLSQALKDGDHIECLIRESGVNQDGKTSGITMPSQVAQEILIRETYRKAGLDITKASDRPQFFEAHGTGTPAGDPIEAEAIRNAFFGSNPEGVNLENLYVGSIKTVVGHTEGTAGIAALMKASLGIQNSVIPPNLLFNKLSDKVAPFYGKLQIPTKALPWPSVAASQPKRASVNSFGFGGTNAHVILESYEAEPASEIDAESNSTVFLPFTFSAASEKSLAMSIKHYANYLENNKSINLKDLAYTLNFRKSTFPFRRSFSATKIENLLSKMDIALTKQDSIATVANTPVSSKLLGVFTGQGAQWPAMGRDLIQNSTFAANIIDKLQSSLDNLPKSDRPSWSIKQELFADASNSQLAKAALSQPLCTVVQVLVVDLLRLAGIHFDAVVGHSSGEMGAAYAAGFLSAEDAVKIAYYRGVHSAAASSPSGAKGGMMAVGTTLEDAEQLCDLEEIRGRIHVAACNSQSSVTLSGDIDALEEAESAFKDEGKFVRKLKVDTAYHSHHMHPCAGPYIRSLESCNIRIQSPTKKKCAWFSSVTGKAMSPDDPSLLATYWSDNMTGRVNFAQAVGAAIEGEGPFTAAFEVGPHPALRGPALQTIKEISGAPIPYSGTLERGSHDIEAFADALGFAISFMPGEVLTLNDFIRAVSSKSLSIGKLLKDLPAYGWEHDRIYWMETRLGRAFRTRNSPVHELLGTLNNDGSNRGLRWRNVLSPAEVPWLKGHKLQGVIVFPGAGYVSMAIEAALIFAGQKSVELLEIRDLIMGKAMVFENEQSTADLQFTLLISSTSKDRVEASFHLEGTTNQDLDDLVTYCTGTLTISYGSAQSGLLPPRSPPLIDASAVDKDRFYTSLLSIGYDYSGDFRALNGLSRTADRCTAFISQPRNDEKKSELLVHPAVLDCAIQTAILALCSPGDNRLWSLHVPTMIKHLKLNPKLLADNSDSDILLPVDASVTCLNSSFLGDVEYYTPDGESAILQMEGIEVVPFSAGTPENDAKLFFDMKWNVASPQGDLITHGARATKKELELGTLCERVAYFYLKTLIQDITEEEWSSAEWFFGQLRKFANHYIEEIETGRQPHCDKAWKNDTREQIYAEMAKWSDNIDLKLMRSVGENLAATLRKQTTILEHMMHENVLNDFYVKGLGLDRYTDFLSNAVLQLSHRYSNMNILEIGAGTGGVTKTIIKQLGRAFKSYTYTDISSGFFEKAQGVFSEYSDCMIFKTLDVERDPVAQGFQEESFDLIVCSLVLHATENLERTLKNVRRLLKPGGYLAMLEITNTGAIRIGFSMGGLPGWWLGYKDNRELNPCVPADRWDTELRKSGFSGIDTITPEVDTHAWLFSIIIAQATDDRVDFLKQPLAKPVLNPNYTHLTILGGTTTAVRKLVDNVQTLLTPWYEKIVRIESAEKFDSRNVPESATVLSLIDLDEPVFKRFSQSRLEGLRDLFEHSRNVLWLTRGARSNDPYAAMMIGFSRTMTMEMPHLRLQFLEHEGKQVVHADKVAETLLRLQVTDTWEKQGDEKLLWTTESELTLEHDLITIPRLFASTTLNNRYNSVRRPITKSLDISSSIVYLEPTDSGYIATEVNTQPASFKNLPGKDLVRIRLQSSSFLAIQISTEHRLFLAKGKLLDSAKWVVALVPQLSSEVTVPRAWTVPSESPASTDNNKLMSLGFGLLAQYIIGRMDSFTTLLIHGASSTLARTFQDFATANHVKCVFTTTELHQSNPQSILLHPKSTVRAIRLALPKDVATFVDLTSENTSIGNSIARAIPEGCQKIKFEDLFGKSTFYRNSANKNFIQSLLGPAYQRKPTVSEDTNSVEVVPITLSELHNQSALNNYYSDTIISWDAPTAEVKVASVETQLVFKPDRTYVLLGLSGQLGRSLAIFMAHHGAKHIVLTSRKPAVEDKWFAYIRELGAEVRVLANDITNRDAVKGLIENIRKTMPPIAGVANGAMVLQDTAISDMDIDIMKRVLAPKVDGSRYLNELFQTDNLDFFILLSSIATVFGQHGQSNYTAANMFLNGLVAQRRRNGLVGSVMVIGAIVGIGYFEREVDEITKDRVIKAGYRMMSERDFHLLFSEAIYAGRDNSEQSYEVITGLREIKEDEDRLAQNPLFHQVISRKGAANAVKETSAKVQLRAQILVATTEDEVKEFIQESFLLKLQVMLQLGALPSMDASAEELGTDSLVAVEIRSWFLDELMVDVPVLKILGGATVAGMVDLAIEKLPIELTPMVQRSSAPTSGSDSEPTLPSNASSSSKSSEDLTEGVLSTPSTEMSFNLGDTRKELMSYGQSRFWILGAMSEDQTAFNIVFVIQLSGEIDGTKLSWAFRQVTHRHSALRTRFIDSDDGEPLQEILAEPAFQLKQRKISSREDVSKEFERLKAREYDLANGDLMDISLLSQSSSQHFLAIGYHHINLDSMSLQNIIRDLDKAYRGIPLGPKALQYIDYSTRQRRAFNKGQMNKELAYWKKEFPKIPPVLPLLPYSKVRDRQPRTSYAHNKVDAKIPASVAKSIKSACTKYRISPFHFHMATFKTLLARVLEIDDLCIGMTDANRTDLEELGSIGLYLNMLPLRFRQLGSQLFAESIKETQSKVRNSLANSRLPFDILIEQLKPERSTKYSPIFQAFIDYKPPIDNKPDLFKCALGDEEYDVGQTAYDIMLSIVDDTKNPVVSFQLQSSLYSQEESERLTRSYMWLLQQFAANPESSLDSVSLHNPIDMEEAIQKSRGPIVELLWPETISHRMEQIFDTKGDLPAMIDGSGISLSYQDLRVRSNIIAANLSRIGVKVGSRIAALLEPGVDWIASLLAILKLGAIYVPLDIRSPNSRLLTVINDCQAKFILAHPATLKQAQMLRQHNAQVIDVCSFKSNQNSTVKTAAKADSHGFLFYTSGTTGIPKGVKLKHAGIINQIEDSSKALKVGPGSRILQQSAFTFDLSLWQTFLSLTTGSCLVVASSAVRSDPTAIVDLVVSQKVTHTLATPSEYMWWFQNAASNDLRDSVYWTTIVAAGEVFLPSLTQAFRALRKHDLKIWNAYGPTETSIVSNMTAVDCIEDSESVPIGRAIQNMASYIVDEALNVLPIGYPGEHVLAGIGISDGYLNNEEQTELRFLPDTITSSDFTSRGWKKMYRTGDRGRMYSDGTVTIEGRIAGDTQVKIRGQRIELQDIEQNLIRTAQGKLTEAVVSVRGQPASFLVAHVTFTKGKQPRDEKSYFQELLFQIPVPQYMKPSLIVSIERLPVTKHFKLDRPAISLLSLPELPEQVDDMKDDSSETAKKMRRAWQKVLPKDTARHYTIDENSDFFHIGGNSMGVVKLKREIQVVFGVTFPLPKLFQHSTLGQMVDLIEPRQASDQNTPIDWISETTVVDSAVDPALATSKSLGGTKKIVAITGSTGFLGRSIVRQLVENPEISRIHCIAVRGTTTRSLPSQFSSPKVIIHYGNLVDTTLGLNIEDVKKIFNSIDIFIHNAADVSFLKSYHSLKPINFETTKEIVRLTRPRQIPIHYISTVGVAHLSGLPEFGEVSARSYLPPTDGSDGYTAGKWASEVYLENSSKAYDIPVWIHRPSSIMGEDPAATDMMANILKFSLILQAVPLLQPNGESLGLNRGFIDLIDVENVTRGILATLSNAQERGLVRYVNHCGEMVLPMSSMGDSEDRKGAGSGLKLLTLEEWTERAREQGLNELVAEFLGSAKGTLQERSASLDSFLVYPRLLKGS